jgi:predicted esterase
MVRVPILFILLSVGLGACGSRVQVGEAGPTDYESMRAHLGELFAEQRYEEAVALLEDALPRFPDHVAANAFNLAFLCGRLGETTKGMAALRFALDRGAWFNIYAFGQPQWNVYREVEGFEGILAANDSLRREAQRNATPGMKVVLPSSYDPDNEYPLFIALHGGNGNMEDFSEVWRSDLLSEGFIVAHLQSSLIVSMTGYSWTEDLEVSRSEIADAFRQLGEEYPIDRDRVMVGGFSAGGIAALDVVLRDAFPVAGFVVLCPGRPESFTDTAIIMMRERGVRGTILTTEMDPNLPVQREMVASLGAAGFQYQFTVTPNIGHWIPENLGVMIDQAIRHIENR